MVTHNTGSGTESGEQSSQEYLLWPHTNRISEQISPLQSLNSQRMSNVLMFAESVALKFVFINISLLFYW